MIENDKGYPVKLKKGSVLGRVISVREIDEKEVLFEAAADPTSCVAAIQSGTVSKDRDDDLLKALHINKDSLTKQELK